MKLKGTGTEPGPVVATASRKPSFLAPSDAAHLERARSRAERRQLTSEPLCVLWAPVAVAPNNWNNPYIEPNKRTLPLIIDRLVAGGYVLGEVERALGLSHGYLSKVRHEKVSPSFQLEALLRLVDDAPRATLAAIARHQGVLAPRSRRVPSAVSVAAPAPRLGRRRPSHRRPSQALILLTGLAEELDDKRVRWALTGARAMAAFGVYRDTIDVDILVHTDDRHALTIVRDRGLELGFSSDDHAFCFPPRRSDPNDKLDIHFPRLPPLDDAVARPERRRVGAALLPVVSPLDLAAWKLMSTTAKDQADAAALISLGIVDRGAVKELLTRLLASAAPHDPYARRMFAPSRALAALEIGS